ncbi:MAG: hypothetical protein AABX17_01005 [Nanoarchaeota archaeon]
MKKRAVSEFVYWTPRILSIVFIVFLALFSLDVFSMNLTFTQTLLALFMHNIPSLVLLIILLISWKYEIVGGIAFILAGLFYITQCFNASLPWYTSLVWCLEIALPAFLVGILFLVNWFKKKN